VNATKRIDDDLLPILGAMSFDGNVGRLSGSEAISGFMAAKTYKRVNAILEGLGGKWDRRKRAHIFPEGTDARARVLDAASAGFWTDEKRLYQFYETPPALAQHIVEWAEIGPGMKVLEPSAGKGALARRAEAAGATITCCEMNPEMVWGLSRMGYEVFGVDFLAIKPFTEYDRVVMNPPFTGGQDMLHVIHAANFVRPGGILVAVMSPGFRFRSDNLAQAFRLWLDDYRHEVQFLPGGSFRESGTDVNAVLVKLWKPG